MSAVSARLLIALVHVYQVTLSPLLGGSCRFAPSCSAYAIEALERHGAARGSWLACGACCAATRFPPRLRPGALGERALAVDRNFFLAVALSFAVLVLWTMYTESQAPPPEPAVPRESAGAPVEPAGTTPLAATELPPPAPIPPLRPRLPAPPPEQRIRVRTDLVDAEFTTWGGALVRWSLLEYDDPSQPGRPPVEITTAGPDGARASRRRSQTSVRATSLAPPTASSSPIRRR